MYKIANEKHLRESSSSFSDVFKAIINDVMWRPKKVHATSKPLAIAHNQKFRHILCYVVQFSSKVLGKKCLVESIPKV